MKFDPTVIEEFARRLLAQARSTIITFTVLGALVGGAVGWSMRPDEVFALVGALIGSLVGFSIGRERAFRLRLAAHAALCQVAIEKNTRKTARSVGLGSPEPRKMVA